MMIFTVRCVAVTDVCHVYVDKREALKAIVKLKGARFKAFSSRDMAENFSKGLCEGGVSPHKPSPEKSSAASVTGQTRQ